MCYRCRLCGRTVEQGRKQIRVNIQRTDKSIADQIEVCGSCDAAIKDGVSMHEIGNGIPLCDLCGEPATNGQITADTIICCQCARKGQQSSK